MAQVTEVPKGTVRASKIVAGNAMLMAATEIVIEILVVAGAHFRQPDPSPVLEEHDTFHSKCMLEILVVSCGHPFLKHSFLNSMETFIALHASC